MWFLSKYGIDHSLKKKKQTTNTKPTKYGSKSIYLPFHTWNLCVCIFLLDLVRVLFCLMRFEKLWFGQCFYVAASQCYAFTISSNSVRFFCLVLCCATLFKMNSIRNVRNQCMFMCVFSSSVHRAVSHRVIWMYTYLSYILLVQSHIFFLFPLRIGQFFWVSNPFSYNICSIKYGIECVF